ncbi:GerMN domain-containing protein [Pseudarthrobacter sp. J75]|uniref:GerMN domain-containing protein n=1 Tax=unclassified Pseudarthrobacter TaxID=2647000 RepID=UPI002E80999E|nr:MULTISPECIES: GerMN domain-containing protein [unclassified Pseudarthrobacter]MEE2523334.1 GerMN domain-containing protein [Pseudarthrobacter sp. J47]MEE2529299.1 GerMN domain-containing protein [Pseudarthrobacter sp. J75]MEE2569180.1 GerMN domain-containing protein [Pseudarthrobacter sp. J64]
MGLLRRAALLGVLPMALALSSCVANPVSPSSAPPATPGSSYSTLSVPASNAPLETTQSSNKAPIYWIGRSNNDVFLYREFRDVPERDNPVTRALRAMMSETPLDPDFFTPWQNPGQLETSISGQNIITVDVSDDAFNSTIGADMAELAVQQLVHTATAAAASSGLVDASQQIQVVVLVDGHTDYQAFGHVRLGAPMARAAGLVAPVWIIDPQENVSAANGTVKVTGRSTDSGDRLRWQLLRENSGQSSIYLSGETFSATDSGSAGLFTLDLTLDPGTYQLRVSRIDVESAGLPLYTDTRTFHVG